MKRLEVRLDEPTYQAFRNRADERGISMAALIRGALREHLGRQGANRRLADFRFIGSGRASKSGLEPLSERHDEALAEDFSP